MIKKINLFIVTLLVVVGFSIFAGGCGDNSMIGLEVLPPNKIEYFVGEEFDPTGMLVKAVYKKGDKEVIESGKYTLSVPDMKTAGLKDVVVNYSDKEASFKIRIKEPTLSGLSFSGSLTKTTQEQGEPFDATGVSFNAVYDNGDSEPIDIANIEFVSTNLDERNRFINVDANTEITAKYNGVVASEKLVVNVIAPTAQRRDVTFNKNTSYNVNDMPANMRVEINNTVGGIVNPSLKGFEFAGWYTEAECTNEWIMDTSTVTDNVELYAKWDAKTYIVKYVVADEELAGGNKTTYTAEEGEFKDSLLVGVSVPHYDFKGWYLDEDCVENQIEKLSYGLLPDEGSEIVVYAKLEKTVYSVNFDLLKDNADCTLAWAEGFEPVASYTYGQTVTLPVKENLVLSSNAYQFDGWYLEGDDTHTVVTTIGEEEDGSKNYVALISLKPTFNFVIKANGGKLEDLTESNTIEIIEGELATRPADPVREGYNFTDWYIEGTGKKYDFESAVTSDMTIIARWNPKADKIEASNSGEQVNYYLVGNLKDTELEKAEDEEWLEKNLGFKLTYDYNGGNTQYVIKDLQLSAGDTFRFIIVDSAGEITWKNLYIEATDVGEFIQLEKADNSESNLLVLKDATFNLYVKANSWDIWIEVTE